MDQIFALQQIFEKSWGYAKEVNACFVNLEKAYDRIPTGKLWAVLLPYGIDGQLLIASKSLYMHSEVCVHVNSATTKPFRVSVGLWLGCSLSPILFLIYVDRIVKKSESCDEVKIGDCTVQHLLFADDLDCAIRLYPKWSPASSWQVFGCMLCSRNENQYNKNRNHVPAQITKAVLSPNWWSTTETVREIRVRLIHMLLILIHMWWLGVSFTCDDRQKSELYICIGKARAVMRQLHRSVVLKRELCTKAKLSIFRSVYVPILTLAISVG